MERSSWELRVSCSMEIQDLGTDAEEGPSRFLVGGAGWVMSGENGDRWRLSDLSSAW